MLMKVARTLTSKGLVLYYSATGNTRAMIEFFDKDKFDIVNIRKNQSIDFNLYNTIIFGTSTWGRGIPPRPFFKIRDELRKIRGKKIGLFGSGRSEFEYFCGALDLLEELLKDNNKILFNFKYEGYPKESVKNDFNKLIKGELYEDS